MTDNTQTILSSAAQALKLKKYTLSTPFEAHKQSFQKRLIYIGSHPDSDFCLAEPSISRQHAKLELDENGCRLVDLGSKNGTFIGDIRINDIYLTNHTTFRCGAVEITFELQSDTFEVAISKDDHFGRLLGHSIAMREIFGLLERIAPTPATVLIEGESGSGKELVASAIREYSDRRSKPFIIFDCSAVSKDLIESELFGHVKGAFTGAVSDRKGAFLQANGGTIFLDEIGELSLDLQPKLLRVLENRIVRPVGGETTYPVDVRVIAATNRNLAHEVENGNFREDLYYRLAVIKIDMPPLRKRPEDLPLLVEHFLAEASAKFNRPAPNISFSTLQKLRQYQWPGNVRELKNFIERACLLSTNDRLETRFLNPKQEDITDEYKANSSDSFIEQLIEQQMPFKDAKQTVIEQFETAYWTKLLETTRGNISKAARLADIHRKTAEYIIRKLNISIKPPPGSDEE